MTRLHSIGRRLARMGRAGFVAARLVFAPLTGLGRTLLALGLAAWAVGIVAGWAEMLVLSAAWLAAVAIGLLSTLRGAWVVPRLEPTAERVTVGTEVSLAVAVTNPRQRRARAARLSVPVGDRLHDLTTPALEPGASWTTDRPIPVPTGRRGVIVLGPPEIASGDPLGIATRQHTRGAAGQVVVHPRTVPVDAFRDGWLRDLEGRSTNDLSPADVAFHTLREYVPGDDRRHIHWRSSAKMDRLMVRQYVDTRRSHLGLVLSLSPDDWADHDEFELGIEIVASLACAAHRAGQETSVVAGRRLLPRRTTNAVLDALAGLEIGAAEHRLPDVVRRGLPLLTGVSVAGVVAGSAVTRAEIRAQCQRVGPHAATIGFRCDPDAATSRLRVDSTTVVDIAELAGLARIVGPRAVAS